MTGFEAITLLRPWLLVALLPLALVWLLVHRRRAALMKIEAPIAPHLLAALTMNRDAPTRGSGSGLLFAVAALMIVAAAGPAWRAAPSPFVGETEPLVVALDLSSTMLQQDVTPSRLERAKQKIRDLIALRAGGQVGLVAYAGSAHVVMPLTSDPTVILPFLEALDPALMPKQGRRASVALSIAEELLGNAGSAGSVLFVTDGGDAADGSEFPDGGASRVALLVAPDGDASGVTEWARRAGVDVVQATIDDGDVREVQRALASRLARRAAADGRLEDDGWMLALPAALLMLFWFRRGTVLRLASAILLLAPLLAGEAKAGEIADLFWTPDQQGRRLYEAHRYPEAAAAFADPQWRAVALFRAGRYDEAADILVGIRTSTAQFNRGVALARGRDYAGAKAAFQAAIDLDPSNGEARENLAVTERIIAYLTEARDAEDQETGAEPPDSTVDDLEDGEGRRAKIDTSTRLSEAAAEDWMRAVETKPADFLKSRFAVEAAEGAQ